MPEDLYLYLTCPPDCFATPEFLNILRMLHEEYPGYKIIDSNSIYPKKALRFCRECMDILMKIHYFPRIKDSAIFAIWAPIKDCSLNCQLHYAWQLDKPCVYISYQHGELDIEDLVPKTYHQIETQTPAEYIV